MKNVIGGPGWRPVSVHPEAAEFPLMPGDVEALAADIKDVGLLDPIVIDADGVLIDGRTRLAACELAGVEPRFQMLNGHDAVRFIWSHNRKRRQLTQGQFAMIGAMGAEVLTTAHLGGKGREGGIRAAARKASVGQATMAKAFLVRDYAGDLVDDVRFGRMTLDLAEKQAEARKRDKEWREDGLATLRKIAPDVAARVAEGELTIEQGRKQHEQALAAEKDQRDSVFLGFAKIAVDLAGFQRSSALPLVPTWLAEDSVAEELRRYFPGGVKELREKMTEARAGLDAVDAVLSSIPLKKGRK